MYLIHLTNKGKSANTLNEAYYAISWTHKLAGVVDPCKSDLVISVKEGALRSIGRFTIRKEHITPDIIKNIVAIYNNARADLKHLRIACMCLISCACFSRYSELSNLRRDNLTFYEQYVKLFLEGSKTDVYRESRDVLISKPIVILVLLTYYSDICLQLILCMTVQILFSVHFHFANRPVLTKLEKVNFLIPQQERQCYLPSVKFWD